MRQYDTITWQTLGTPVFLIFLNLPSENHWFQFISTPHLPSPVAPLGVLLWRVVLQRKGVCFNRGGVK